MPSAPGERKSRCERRQRRASKPSMPDCPCVEAQHASNAQVNRAGTVWSAGMSTRALEHAVAVRDEITGINLTPGHIALLKRIKPVVKNLRVRPQRLVGVCALHRMLVQEPDGRLNELEVRTEEQWKARRPCLSQRHAQGGSGTLTQRGRHLTWIRECSFANDLDHVQVPPDDSPLTEAGATRLAGV